MGAFQLLWLLCSQLINRVHVHFLPIYTPSKAEIASPELFAANVRRLMAAAMNVPATLHSFDDVRLQACAAAAAFPPDEVVVETGLVKQLFDVDFPTIKKHLDTFIRIDTERSGRISYEQFAATFGVTDSPELRRLFESLDVNHSGGLEFREYLLGLAMLHEHPDTKRVIKLAFNTFNANGDGRLSQSELLALLSRSGHSELDVAKAFEEADRDGDGKLSYDEFCVWAEKHPDIFKVFTDTLSSGIAAVAMSDSAKKNE